MRDKVWNPRGPVRWPEWRNAQPGDRVRHVTSGWVGTFIRWPKVSPARKAPGYAVIQWDRNGVTSHVVAYAWQLEKVNDG